MLQNQVRINADVFNFRGTFLCNFWHPRYARCWNTLDETTRGPQRSKGWDLARSFGVYTCYIFFARLDLRMATRHMKT